MQDKPVSMSVKDYIMNQVTEELKQPLDIVEKVISFQGEDLLWAFKNTKCVEISGFGKFTMSPNKLNKLTNSFTHVVEGLQDKEDTHSVLKKERMEKALEYLNSKK